MRRTWAATAAPFNSAPTYTWAAVDALFSANRKARLWDQFCKLYAGIATEAEDDFHSLFGKAFAKAYDEQMERFRSGG